MARCHAFSKAASIADQVVASISPHEHKSAPHDGLGSEARLIGAQGQNGAEKMAKLYPVELQQPLEEETPREHVAPKPKRDPQLPTASEVEEHYLTHRPYRSWCPICVAAYGKEDPHKRQPEKSESEVPEVGLDYDYYSNKQDDEKKVTSMIMKDRDTGMLWGHVCSIKGPTDTWGINKIVKNLEVLGRAKIVLKTDGEPALIAFQSKIITARDGTTIPKNPPAYNPESNGAIESGVKMGNEQLRAIKLALEERLGRTIEISHPIYEWGLQHGCWIVSNFSLGHDGKVPQQRLTGRKWTRPLCEFGELVLGKLARQRMDKGKRSKPSGARRKMVARSIPGIWVGIVERTGENIIISPTTGRAIRVRTVTRVPMQSRWNYDYISKITATPRCPDPRKAEKQDIEATHDEDVGPDGPIEKQTEPEAGEKVDGRSIQTSDHVRNPRELRITKRLLEKYGYSDDCPSCNSHQLGLDSHRKHSEACRTRIYNSMGQDDVDREMVERAISRVSGRGVPAEDTTTTRPTPATVPVAAPIDEDDAVDNDEVPIEEPADMIDSDEELVDDMERGMEESAEADGAAADEELPGDDLQPDKRELEDADQHRGYNDESKDGAAKRQRLTLLAETGGESRYPGISLLRSAGIRPYSNTAPCHAMETSLGAARQLQAQMIDGGEAPRPDHPSEMHAVYSDGDGIRPELTLRRCGYTSCSEINSPPRNTLETELRGAGRGCNWGANLSTVAIESSRGVRGAYAVPSEEPEHGETPRPRKLSPSSTSTLSTSTPTPCPPTPSTTASTRAARAKMPRVSRWKPIDISNSFHNLQMTTTTTTIYCNHVLLRLRLHAVILYVRVQRG